MAIINEPKTTNADPANSDPANNPAPGQPGTQPAAIPGSPPGTHYGPKTDEDVRREQQQATPTSPALPGQQTTRERVSKESTSPNVGTDSPQKR